MKSPSTQWDVGNRLVGITDRPAAGEPASKLVAGYTYDALGRRIAKQIDEDGEGAQAARSEAYVYLGEHIALAFTDDDVTDATPPQLANRYLHGPYIDQLLADEQVGIEASTLSHLIWPLGDHLGTIRDLAERDLVSGLTVVVAHMTYDTFGRVWTSTTPSAESRFAFTGRDLDPESDLYHYRARYYDPATGQFISADPIGFEAGDGNLYRYVGNGPIDGTDPSGMIDVEYVRGHGIGGRYEQDWERLGYLVSVGVAQGPRAAFNKGLISWNQYQDYETGRSKYIRIPYTELVRRHGRIDFVELEFRRQSRDLGNSIREANEREAVFIDNDTSNTGRLWLDVPHDALQGTRAYVLRTGGAVLAQREHRGQQGVGTSGKT